MRNGRALLMAYGGGFGVGIGETLRILEVASICQALRKGGRDVNKALSVLSIKVDEDVVVGVIRGGLDVEKTLDFFKWAGLQNGFKHHAKTYTPMIWRLCRAGKSELLPSLLHDLKRDNCTVDASTCKRLLHSFIKAGMFDKALEVLDSTEELGSDKINPQLYNSLLVALLKNDQVHMALSLFNTMLKANIHPYTSASNRLLVALRKANMMAEFEKSFLDLRTARCDFDSWSYNICIHAFGIVGQVDVAEKLFEEMKDRGCAPDLCTYNCLIAVRCKAGRLNEAVNIFEGMKEDGPDPNAVTYGTLIRGFCKVNKISEAHKIFNEMAYNGCNPELIVYNALLDGLFKVGNLADACQFFEKMVQEGVVPNSCSYNILIDGLIKKGRAAAAYKLFDDLKKKKQCVDAVTYSIMILYFCKVGRVEDSLGLLEEMESRGLVPDMVTITSLLIALRKSCKRDWAHQLMKRIGDSTVIPNIVRWTAEMEEITKTRKEEARNQTSIFVNNNDNFDSLYSQQFVPKDKKKENENFLPADQMFGTKTQMNDHIVENSTPKDLGVGTATDEDNQEVTNRREFSIRFSSDMSLSNINGIDAEEGSQNSNENTFTYYISRGTTDYAVKQDISEKNCNSEAYPSFLVFRGRRIQGRGIDSFNNDMFNTYMSFFSKQGKINVACKLFQYMIEKGSDPRTYTYNTLLSGFVKKGYFDEAWGLFLEMGRKLCVADIATYNSIIDGLGKTGETDMVYAVLEAMLRKGGYLDIMMYNTLINTAGKGGQLDDADNLFRRMTESGLTPDVVTYNTLIEVYSKAGRVKEAYGFLRMMIDAGCSPNHVTDTILDFLEKQIEKLRFEKASIKRPL